MKKNGYTLVEIVIVLAIIILMALVSMPAFNKYNLSNNFDTKAEEIVSLFNKAYLLSKSPPRVTVSATAEYVCDTIYVNKSDSLFKIILKRTTSSGGVVDCKTGSSTIESVYQSLEVNDNPSLDVLSVAGAGDISWVFSKDAVTFGAGGNTFYIHSEKLTNTAGENRNINFALNKDQNSFSIKRDQ